MAVELELPKEFYSSKGIKHETGFYENARKMSLFTCSWVPANREPKSLVFLIHGYSLDCGLYWQDTGVRLAENGYAVFGIDYEGHGRSDGQKALIMNIDEVVDDCIAFFKTIKVKREYVGKRSFLFAFSLGGAIALLMDRKEPLLWDGAVLQAPMVKISDKMKPPAVFVSILKYVAHMFPSWAIAPSTDVIESAFRDPEKRSKTRKNPYTYQGRPRLATALTLLNVCEDLSHRLVEVTIPFLLLHGDADSVTDFEESAQLYEQAASVDKTFKLYPGMWHSLTEGELDENIEIVFKDIIEWLDARSVTL